MYQWQVTATKAFWSFIRALALITGTLGAVATATAGVLPTDYSVFEKNAGVYVLAFFPPAWRAIENYRKNGGTSNAPLWQWPFGLLG